MRAIERILADQDGVISRRQALEAGLTGTDVARLVRRREWTRVHEGVYVDHTGPLTWRQRAWAAVLACWPAALAGASARRAHEGPGRQGTDTGPIQVVIDHARRIKEPDGVDVLRMRRFEQVVQWNLAPPRMRYDDAILSIADTAASDLAAIAVLADACGGRRTTAQRLLGALSATAWVHRRAWLTEVLQDVALGTCSVLEHGYLARVERPHGLPHGLRQVAGRDGGGRRLFRDVQYGGERPRWRQNVELDGRLDHTSVADRDRDLDRDLDAAVELEDTVRLGFGQVFARGCRTAYRLDQLLRRKGWRGAGHACPDCPPDLAWRSGAAERKVGNAR
ncbi:MAG TPA: type IV toxin-antitoxin system AbiEi family antitoxin domain-containing protein [Nocardioides sp.]|nr:type IV toxin-antitoxin system AbiEi family antitoxin domain-containing protein [Nocardioides sp.]